MYVGSVEPELELLATSPPKKVLAAAGEVTEESLFEKIGLGELALLDLTRTLIAQQGKAGSEAAPDGRQRRLNAASKITFDTHEVYPATKPGERPPNEIELVT